MGRLRGLGKLPVTAEVVAKEHKGARDGPGKVSLVSAMIREATALDVILIFLAILASLANGAMLPLFAVTFGDFVNALTDADVMPRAQKAASNLAILAAAVLVAFYLQAFLWMWTGAKSSNRLRTKYLAAVLKQDIQYFDTQATTGALLRGLHEDCSAVQRAISEKMGSILQHTSTFALGFALAFYQGWDMTLVLLACLPFLAAVGAALGKMTGRMESKAATAYAAAGDLAQQSLQQLRTVLSYGQQQRMQALYQAALSDTTKVGTQQGLVNGLCLGGLNVVLFAAYSGSLYYGAVRVGAGGMTPGGVLAVMMSALLGSFSLGQAAPLVQEILKGQAALQSLHAIITRKPNIDVSTGGEAPPSVDGRLEFKAVSFSYPSTPERLILKQFSIAVAPGTTLALVGPSGSGKSTVVSLLQRFYDPASGALLLDGRDLRAYDLAWLRSQMALVSQDPVLFAASIDENIAMGRPGATLGEVQAAAAAANIHNVVVGLPQGYNTPLGDKGLGLSGGQKQRIAIARAILKNPKILLLDEATSALDSTNEAAVTAALADLTTTHQRTCVVVAHRLSTVQGADVIAVVEQGSVVQQGKHSQLLTNKQGAYYKLLQLQQSQQQQQQQQQSHQQPSAAHKAAPLAMLESHPSISSGGNLRKRTTSWASCTSNNPSAGGTPTASAAAANAEGFAANAAANMALYNSTTLLLDVGPADLEAMGAPGAASWQPPALEQGAAEAAEAAASSRYSTRRAFWRLAKMNTREAHLGLLGAVGSFGHGVITPGFAFVLALMVGAFTTRDADLQQQAATYSAVLAGIGGWSLVMISMQMWALGAMGARLASRVRGQLLGALLRQEIGWHDLPRNSPAQLCLLLSQEAGCVRGAVGDLLGMLCQTAGSLALGFGVAFWSDWRMALVVTGTLPLLVVGAVIQTRYAVGGGNSQDKAYSAATQTISEALSAMRTIHSYNLQGWVCTLYADLLRHRSASVLRACHLAGLGLGYSQAILFAIMSLVVWFGGLEVSSGRASIAEVMRAFLCVIFAALGMAQAQVSFPELPRAKAAAQRILALLDRASPIEGAAGGVVPPEAAQGDVELRGVVFDYPARRGVPVLQSLSVKCAAGTTLALVGPSGSGKSTVVSLLQRFYDPASGALLLDGRDLRAYDLAWLRQQMALVSQECLLFVGSVRDNIAFGCPEADLAQVMAAAQAAHAHGFIMALPQGYDTPLGVPGAVQLSGGQKQRLSIARAVLCSPRILLLDEPTSALDAASEAAVSSALAELARGHSSSSGSRRTTIVVAHRLSTIRDADKIAVVVNGCVVEQGSHAELMAAGQGNSQYARLVAAQQGHSS